MHSCSRHLHESSCRSVHDEMHAEHSVQHSSSACNTAKQRVEKAAAPHLLPSVQAVFDSHSRQLCKGGTCSFGVGKDQMQVPGSPRDCIPAGAAVQQVPDVLGQSGLELARAF